MMLVDASARRRRARAPGLAVYVYTVDEPAEMERLLGLGVDGLFTNFPDRLRAAALARIVPQGMSLEFAARFS